ncbi:two-component sensor histidine kinase [Paraburkholderia strydomiana]|nr:two-component sensor histidine kinase [Paraburkholderia strydomiana]
MKNPFNTLFGQLALMTVGLIVIVHLTSLVLVDRDRGQIDTGHAQRALLLAVQSQRDGAVTASQVSAALGVSVINADNAIPYGCPAPCQDTTGPFQNALRAKLPRGSAVVADPESGNVWVRYAGNAGWLKLERSMLPARRFISASAMMLVFAVILALIGAWYLQRPLHRLAIAAREFRLGHRAPVVPASGPREVKGLIDDFNQMVHELARAEQERAVMLAGVAHDLRAPITRMQVRADLLPDEANRSGFLRDAESLSRIVTQFLDFARESADRSPPTSVDAHCRRHYGDSLEDDALVRLDLQAGDGFGLPLVDLDRILTNLIENALTYGEPPVEISTSRHNGHYTLTVLDRGGGIPGGQLERALQPFVRLDEARSGDAHCGLGLAIVRRLVRYNGGVFHADNAVDGGFVVSMTFPA